MLWKSWNNLKHREKHTQSYIVVGKAVFIYLFVYFLLISWMQGMISRRGAWSDDAMHQRQPMWCAMRLSCHPSLIPASRPCLYVKAVMPVVSHSSGALCSVCLRVFVHVCVCLFMQEFVCTCVLLSWQIYSEPNLHVSIGGDSGVVRDGGGPFERLPSFSPSPVAFSPLLHSPADIFLQTNWMN